MNNPPEDERASQDDVFLGDLFARAEEEIVPAHPDYDPDEGLERFLDQLGNIQHVPRAGRLRDAAARWAAASATRRNRLSAVGHAMMSHPVALAIHPVIALAVMSAAKWSQGTARVHDLKISTNGWVLVEMEDGNVFAADPEYLESLQSAHQAETPVRYWINNFYRINALPYGGIGEIPTAPR